MRASRPACLPYLFRGIAADVQRCVRERAWRNLPGGEGAQGLALQSALAPARSAAHRHDGQALACAHAQRNARTPPPARREQRERRRGGLARHGKRPEPGSDARLPAGNGAAGAACARRGRGKYDHVFTIFGTGSLISYDSRRNADAATREPAGPASYAGRMRDQPPHTPRGIA